jgi:3-hexulose-6-phosphate synthase
MTLKPSAPLLQLAVDVVDREKALKLAKAAYPHFDIIEAGTPLIYEEGLAIVETFKALFPDKLCLADLKIMDAGFLEATSAFRRGADFVTVLGVADNATIQGAMEAAVEYGKSVMVDLINAPDPVGRAEELQALGQSYFCAHTAHDVKGCDSLSMVRALKQITGVRVSIAGGINLQMAAEAVELGADFIVVGGAIGGNDNPAAAARAFHNQIRNKENE